MFRISLPQAFLDHVYMCHDPFAECQMCRCTDPQTQKKPCPISDIASAFLVVYLSQASCPILASTFGKQCQPDAPERDTIDNDNDTPKLRFIPLR